MMPALYMPIGFMLTALIFRGVAFEFRARAAAGTGRRLWDQTFHWGSLTAALSQGLALGALVQGVRIEDGRFAGGTFDWLTPFSFTVAWALVWGYALLGSAWLIIKTEQELLIWARRSAAVTGVLVLVMMVVVSLWVLVLDAPAAARWGVDLPSVDWGRLLPLTPIPLLVGGSFFGLFVALRRGATYAPYLCSVALFLLGYIGLLVGIWPHLVPYAVTIRQAAAAPEAQGFLLIGALALLPLILGYTGYVYWTFRGKIKEGESYH
jgi:cytochrome d ubiquinol oxidase subunit II